MSYTPPSSNKISTINSLLTGTGLIAGATYQGASEDVSEYGRVGISVTTAFGNPTDGVLWIEVSHDGVNWGGPPRTFSDTSTAQPHMWNIVEKYFRIRYVNGTTPTGTNFSIQTQYSVNADVVLGHQLDEVPLPEHESILTKAVLWGIGPDGVYAPQRTDGPGFQTTDNLLASGAYDSGILDLQGFSQVQTHIMSDVDGTIVVEFIADSLGTDIVRTLTIPYAASDGFQLLSAPAFTPYVRYKYTNGGTPQGDMFYETKFLNKALSGQILGMDSFIAPNMVANLGRNVIVGQNDAGRFENVATDNQNHLKVDAANNRVTYDEFPVSEFTAISQLTFPYNINADLTNVIELGTGAVTQADNMAIVSTSVGVTATESAALESVGTITFRAGEGAVGRFSALFTDLAPNGATSVQGIGLGDANDGYGFTLAGTSSELNVTYRTSGVSTSFTQSLWNADTMDGTGSSSNPSGVLLDVTKGNVYQVSYGSGFGCVYFSIESQTTGHMVLVHTFHLSNVLTIPSSYNPTFALRSEVFKDGTADANNYVMKVADMSSFTQGQDKVTGTVNAFENSKTIGTTETNLFTLQNKATFAGHTNKVSAILSSISLINDTNGAGTFRLWENATLGGVPSYTDISTNTSVISQDTAGTTITGGKLLWTGGAGKDNGSSIDLHAIGIRMRPNNTYTFTSETLGGANPMSIGLVWVEDF